MKKLKILTIIMIIFFTFLGFIKHDAYAVTSITSSDMFERGNFDKLVMNMTSAPTITYTGSESVTIETNCGRNGNGFAVDADSTRLWINTSEEYAKLDLTITAFFSNCGTLNGRPIDMKIIYSDITTGLLNIVTLGGDGRKLDRPSLAWTAYGTSQNDLNEWFYGGIEHVNADIYFYYHGDSSPIQYDTAYISMYSCGVNEGAGSHESSQEYVYSPTHLGTMNFKSYGEAIYGVQDGTTADGTLNALAFQFKSKNHMSVDLYDVHQNPNDGSPYCIGYHFQFRQLVASVPDDPVKSQSKDDLNLGDEFTYTIRQEMATRYDTNFHYSSLVFKDPLDLNLEFKALRVYNESGTDITSTAGTTNYNDATGLLTYTFNSSYLQSINYNGQIYRFEIDVKLKEDAKSGKITNKANVVINNEHTLESNTTNGGVSAKVIVHHKNRQGATLASDDTYTGTLGDHYTTSSKSIPSYKLYNTSGNTSGTMDQQTTEVTYYYDIIRVNINVHKTLQKTDSTLKRNLSGVVFRLDVIEFGQNVELANPDRTYYSSTSDASGSCTITGVPYGTYRLTEMTIPSLAYGGLFFVNSASNSVNTYTITVNEDRTYTFEIDNVAKKMQITVYKEDIETGTTTQGDAHLEGAQYTLYSDAGCTNAIETITIQKNTDGTYSATSGWYLSGTYYVKETKPPEGYLIDTTVYTVSQDPAQQTEERVKHSITSKDPVKRNDIEIVKNIEKTDSTPKQSLEGAVFTATLISDPSQKWTSTPTDENGNCVIEQLPYGRYQIEETTIPDIAYNGEFYIDGATERSTTFNQFVELDDTEREPYKWGDITDVAKKMQITIYKEDNETGTQTQGDAHLEGAEYTLYRDENCTDAIETITIQKNADGTYSATSGWYLVGKYWIKETTPPEGYLIDETVYMVEQIPAEQIEEHSYHSITSKDKVKEGIIKVAKYNNNSETSTKNPAVGAKLRLTLNSRPEVYYDAIVDEKGYLEFVDEHCRATCYPYTIPYGKYTITEVAASNSEANIFIKKQETEIREQDQEVNYILDDEYVRMKLTIAKIDNETLKPIPEGATFKIWDVNNKKWYEEEEPFTGHIINEFTTNDKGQLTINRHLEAGTYVIYETQAPYGYYLEDSMRVGAEGYEFTVAVGENGDVVLKHGEKEEVLEYTTEQYDNKPTKMYKYTAVIEDPPQKVIIKVKDFADQFTHTEKEDSEYGDVDKPAFEEKGLEGVEFDIVVKEDVYTPDGTLKHRKGEVVGHIVTDENGEGQTGELYLGEYDVVPKNIPDGYVFKEGSITVDVEYSNQYERVQEREVEFRQDKQKVKFSFEKVFEELKEAKFKFEEKRAVFGIYTAEVIKNYRGENTIGIDELVDVIETDENNIVKNTVELPKGNYYVKELYVSNPYEKSTDRYEFRVEFTNSKDEEINITIDDGKIENVPEIGELELLVYPEDIYDENELGDLTPEEREKYKERLEELAKKYGIAGKTYEVFHDKECKQPVITVDDEYATFITDENGTIHIEDMPTGTYYFKEIIAPYGYELSDEVIKAEIRAGKITILVAKEPFKKAKLLEKRDTFTKDVISEVEFKITDEEENIVYVGKTDEKGILNVPIIYFENGAKYYYQEIKAKNIYELDEEKHEFIAEYDEEKCEWTLELIDVENNRKTINELILRKTDRETGELLGGCEFTIVLLDENGEPYVNEYGETIYLVEKGYTNDNGEYIVENVPYGTYKFVEITPPEGYELDEDITGLIFTVDENTEDTLIFEVTNTGDIAIIALVCVAVVCVIGIAFVILKNRKMKIIS